VQARATGEQVGRNQCRRDQADQPHVVPPRDIRQHEGDDGDDGEDRDGDVAHLAHITPDRGERARAAAGLARSNICASMPCVQRGGRTGCEQCPGSLQDLRGALLHQEATSPHDDRPRCAHHEYAAASRGSRGEADGRRTGTPWSHRPRARAAPVEGSRPSGYRCRSPRQSWCWPSPPRRERLRRCREPIATGGTVRRRVLRAVGDPMAGHQDRQRLDVAAGGRVPAGADAEECFHVGRDIEGGPVLAAPDTAR
jgi:hypothetical protein